MHSKKVFQQLCTVNSRRKRQDDENLNSSVIAKIIKLLADNYYDFQIMDRSRRTVTKYLRHEKTHLAIDSLLFKKLDHANNALYDVELAKAQIEHQKPILVGFFLLPYAKLRMLKL